MPASMPAAPSSWLGWWLPRCSCRVVSSRRGSGANRRAVGYGDCELRAGRWRRLFRAWTNCSRADTSSEIIVSCVRWYLRFKLSLRALVEMMVERGLSMAHTTIIRWVQRSAYRKWVSTVPAIPEDADYDLVTGERDMPGAHLR